MTTPRLSGYNAHKGWTVHRINISGTGTGMPIDWVTAWGPDPVREIEDECKALLRQLRRTVPRMEPSTRRWRKWRRRHTQEPQECAAR